LKRRKATSNGSFSLTFTEGINPSPHSWSSTMSG
jgi:hypothetical protein